MEEPQREKCEKCEATKGEFKKVIELVDAGLCVYSKCAKYKQSSPPSPTIDTFIIQNTKSKELTRSDYINELAKFEANNQTRCCKCQPDLKKAFNYLKTVHVLREDEVIGICPICQHPKSTSTCQKCDKTVKRFLLRKATEYEEKYETWVKKVQGLLQSILDTAEIRRPGAIDNSKSLRELKKLLREPKEARDVNIETFPPIEKYKYGFRDSHKRNAEYDYDKGKYFSDPYYAHAGRGMGSPGTSKGYDGYDFKFPKSSTETDDDFVAKRAWHTGKSSHIQPHQEHTWRDLEFENERGHAGRRTDYYRPTYVGSDDDIFPAIEKHKYRDDDMRRTGYDYDIGKNVSDIHYPGKGMEFHRPPKRYSYDFEGPRYTESEYDFDARRHYDSKVTPTYADDLRRRQKYEGRDYDDFEPRRGYAGKNRYRIRLRSTDFETSGPRDVMQNRQKWDPDYEPSMYSPVAHRRKDWAGQMSRAEMEDRRREKWDPDDKLKKYQPTFDRRKDWVGPMSREKIEDRRRQRWDPGNRSRNYPASSDESDHDVGTGRGYPGNHIRQDQRAFERDYDFKGGRDYADTHRGFNRPRHLYPDDDLNQGSYYDGGRRKDDGKERKDQTDDTGATASIVLKSSKKSKKETETKPEDASKKKVVKNTELDLKTIEKMNAREILIARQRDKLYAGEGVQGKKLTSRHQKFLDQKDGPGQIKGSEGYIGKLLTSQQTKADESYSSKTLITSKKKKTDNKPPKQKTVESSELDINKLIKKERPTDSLMKMMKLIKVHQHKREKIHVAKAVKMQKPPKSPIILQMKRPAPIDSEGNSIRSIIECIITQIESDGKIIKGNEVILVQQNLRPTSPKPLLFQVEGHCPSVDLISGSMKPYQYSEGTKSTKSAVDRAASGPAANRLKYELSNKKFIDMGWTKLPTLKTTRRVNIFQMDPVDPKADWFLRHTTKSPILYDTCETLAEINEDGSGKLFYRNGHVALDYLKANEPPGARRQVIYNSGELGSAPVILAAFDYIGNGVVYDQKGNVRLQFNQFEGCVIDSTIGPPGKWKWNNLNDYTAPVVRHLDTVLKRKDQNLQELILQNEIQLIPETDEAMLEIENQNYLKSQKKVYKYKHSEIRMKALKLNCSFSLKVMDQAHIYLRFKDNEVNIKLNLGLKLNSDLIIGTNTIKIGEVVMLKDRRSIGEGSLPIWETRLSSVSETSSMTSSESILS